MADPVSLGTALRVVGGVFLTAFGGGPSKQQRQRIAAAQRAGYRTVGGRVWKSPDGSTLSKKDVLRAGAAIIASGGIPGQQAGTVTQFPKQPKKRPPPQPAGGTPPPPRQPGAVTTGVGVGVGATLGTAILNSIPPVGQWVWNQAQQRWEARKDPRRGPSRRYRRRTQLEIINEQIRRNSQIGTWTGNVNANLPPGGVRRIPGGPAAVEARAAVMSAPLEEIKVTAKRLPVPAIPPLPAGYRIFKAVTTRIGLPGAARYYALVKPFAPLALMGAKELLAPAQKARKKAKEQPQLTTFQQPGLSYMPSFSPYASIAAEPALQPQTAKKCKCKPCKKPKKRGPRKPRAICYRGTYTETRKGLSKYKREQIPCR